ncbi:MAG: FecCD family ABC transporter permease [Enterococcus sp.]
MKFRFWCIGLFIVLAVVSFFSLTFQLDTPLQTAQQIIGNYDGSSKEQVILVSRIARVCVALLAGASLALSGLLMQLHYHNSLADPSLMGVTDGAALAVMVVLSFWPESTIFMRICASILGSFIAYGLIRIALTQLPGDKSAVTLPLVGLILSMILSSITTLLASYFGLAQSLTSWYNSRLYRVEWSDVRYFIFPLFISLLITFALRKQFNVYRHHPEVTIAIGMNRKVYALILQLLVVVLTGVTVGIIGRVAFVGLIVPHMARLIFHNRYEKLILIVPLMGATFVVAADYFSRWVNYPFETPIGIVFAMIGVPVFLWLIRKEKGHGYEV